MIVSNVLSQFLGTTCLSSLKAETETIIGILGTKKMKHCLSETF